MSEEEFINRIINRISKDYGAVIANEIKYIIIRKEKEIDKQKEVLDKIKEYIDKYLYEHVIDDLSDEESKFEKEDGTPIPNAKEELYKILEEIE